MYHVDVSSQGKYTFEVKSKDSAVTVDIQGNGMTPPDLLLASLGSCVGVYIRKYAEQSKIVLNDFSVRVDAEFSKEPPMCFREIKVSIDLKGAAIDDRRKSALLSFIKNCPVHNTLHVNPQVTVAIA